MILGVLFVLLLAGVVAIYLGTKNKTKWGINTQAVSCTKCETPFAKIRKPQTIQQKLWGGYSCSTCNIEVDKWGRDISE